MARGKHHIKGSRRHNFFLQKIVATYRGSSIPLMYPEGILFPSIHWKMANNNCSILGFLPVPLLTESISNSRFLWLHCHVRSWLKNPCCSTSSDPRYTSRCFDILTNLTANNEYTRLVLNIDLSIDNKTVNIGLRVKGDTTLLGSVDNKEMVRNLCFSQNYAPWDPFSTCTCNQKTHFGTGPIKNWIEQQFSVKRNCDVCFP